MLAVGRRWDMYSDLMHQSLWKTKTIKSWILCTSTHPVLVLLDLSAVFDTVDHGICHLENWVGMTGTALEWIKSYQSDRTFSVYTGNVSSSYANITSSVLFLALYYSVFTCYHWVRFSTTPIFLSVFMLKMHKYICPEIHETSSQLLHSQPVLQP